MYTPEARTLQESPLRGKRIEGRTPLQIPRLRSPGFPVELGGVGALHAAFLTESRTRRHGWSHVQEIRVGMTKLKVAT
jgi:hypothetical protein